MPHTPLEKSKIKELSSNVCEVFKYLTYFKEQKPLAVHIQFPKIPTILSESLVWHLISEGRIEVASKGDKIYLGGRKANIIVKKTSGEEVNVEVKATGTNAFQYFEKRDLASAFLVWVHFGDFFKTGISSPIEVFVAKNPSNYFDKPEKIGLKKFKSSVGQELQQLSLTLNDL